MLVLIFGLLLSPAPADSTVDLDECLVQTPNESPPPIEWGQDVRQMWSNDPPAPPDSVRAYLSQVRSARTCFLHLDPSRVSRPYLGHVLQTFYVETALLAGLRRFSEAHRTFEKAHSFLETSSSIPSAENERTSWPSELHQNQGFLHYLLGNLSASIEHYLKAYETTPEDEPTRRLQYLIDVGILHQRTQDYRSARYYYNRAEHLFQQYDLPLKDHSSQLSRILSVQSDLLLKKALNTDFGHEPLKRIQNKARRARQLAEPGTRRYALASSHLSESLSYLGSFDEAYQLNREVRRYARGNDDPRLLTYALLKLGVFHVQTERWAQADSVLREALSRANRLDDLDVQRRILRTLGRLHEMQDHWTEAERFYRNGMAVVEKYRESLTASQWSMTAFAQWREVNRGLTRALLAQDKSREAFVALERSRARHLQDLRTQARVSNQLSPETRARFDSLSRTLTNVRNQLGATSLSEQKKTALRNREARLMAIRQQVLDIDSVSGRPSVNDISAVLSRRDRVLVSYFLDSPWPIFDRAPRSVAFVLSGDTLRTVPLPGLTQDSVQTHVEATSPLFTSRGKPNQANAMHFDLRPLHQLHDAIYAPVAEHLPDERPLTVIPDGSLFHLPFSILVHSMPGGRYSPSEARYVLHDRPTSLELASFLVADTARSFDWSTFDPQMAAYGVSDFDTLRAGSSALRAAAPEAVSDSSMTLPSLPGVQQEVRALQSTVSDARIALNQRATETDFCRSIRRAGVVHVASHAFVNASSPLRNAILLRSAQNSSDSAPDSSAERSPSSSDGVLFLHELQGQRSRIPMVVLSGCNTASGTLRGGEGMEGLQYAFRAMGAQSTVSTLWPVADQASVELMQTFYQNLQDGLPKDVALQQAQLRFLRTHPEQASPFFWASTVLYGSTTPLPLDGPLLPGWAWWALGIVGLFFLAVALLWWNRDRLPAPFCHAFPA